MTDPAIDDIVHRHGKAIVSMDIGQIMNDLMPEAMMKLQQEAGGPTALQINAYELLGKTQDGADLPVRRKVHWLLLHRPCPLVPPRHRMEDRGRHHHRPRNRSQLVGVLSQDMVYKRAAPSRHLRG